MKNIFAREKRVNAPPYRTCLAAPAQALQSYANNKLSRIEMKSAKQKMKKKIKRPPSQAV